MSYFIFLSVGIELGILKFTTFTHIVHQPLVLGKWFDEFLILQRIEIVGTKFRRLTLKVFHPNSQSLYKLGFFEFNPRVSNFHPNLVLMIN
jgi:hypothetical protein